jgi:hypothetical protein
MIVVELDSEDYDLIPRNCDQERAEIRGDALHN